MAIIGRPNVGKSTLLNRLLDEERSIVTPIPGTTRDAIDAELEYDGHRIRLIDTAGIRRKGKTHEHQEKLSVIQARKHLERSDVALLLIDAIEGVTNLDANIGGYAYESNRSVIIVVNKWDAVEGPTAAQDFTEDIQDGLKALPQTHRVGKMRDPRRTGRCARTRARAGDDVIGCLDDLEPLRDIQDRGTPWGKQCAVGSS